MVAACFPASLGNITKQKLDHIKHRLIQDLKKNRVNRVCKVPERQVLPHPLDHTQDLTQCATAADEDWIVATLIIDVCNAFMPVPIHDEEKPFNCCQVQQGLNRTRAEA